MIDIGDIYKFMKFMKEMTYYESKIVIAIREQRAADAGRKMCEITRARQMAIQNKMNEQRLQTYNKKMALWRQRNRTTYR